MLNVVREKTAGWIAKFILGLLFVSFTVWGIGIYNDPGVRVEVASINGDTISQASWRSSYGRFLSSYQQSRQQPLQQEERQLLKERALQTMIDNTLMEQLVAAQGMQVSDKILGQYIASMEHFQEQGLGFDRELYQRSVVAQGRARAFESEMRTQLLSVQLQRALVDSVFVLDPEVQQLAQIREQRRDISWLTLSAADFTEQVAQAPADIEQWYQQHAEQYRQPEQLRIAWLDLQLDDLLSAVDVDEAELRSWYEDNREQFDEPEGRSVEQLIARTAPEATPEQLQVARASLQAVVGRVQEGEEFQAIIESLQEQEEPADIDFVEQLAVARDSLPAVINDFVFAAEVGQHSDLLETEQGVHLVKVTDIQGTEEHNTFDYRRSAVADAWRRVQARALFAERVEQLINAAYEHQDGLEVAALETGLAVQESEFFSRDGTDTGIASHAPVVRAAFSEALKSGDINSDGIDLSDEHTVVLRVLEVQPSRRQSLEEVRDTLLAELIAERSGELAKQEGERLLQALRAGQDRQQLARQLDLQWTDRTDVARDDLELSRQLLRAAFAAGIPAEEESLYEGVQDVDGDYSLLVISAVRDQDIEDQTREAVRAELLDKTGSLEWWSFLRDARAQADVQVYEENL